MYLAEPQFAGLYFTSLDSPCNSSWIECPSASCPKLLEGKGRAAVKHLPLHSTFISEVDKVIYV